MTKDLLTASRIGCLLVVVGDMNAESPGDFETDSAARKLLSESAIRW